MKVLVIDDDPKWQGILRSVVSDLGYACTEAESVEDGIHVIRTQSIKLVLLDWTLDKSDFFVRSTAKISKDTKIIVVTGADTSSVRHLFDLGVDGIITKHKIGSLFDLIQNHRPWHDTSA